MFEYHLDLSSENWNWVTPLLNVADASHEQQNQKLAERWKQKAKQTSSGQR